MTARRLVLILVGAVLLAVFVSRFVLVGLLAQRIALQLVFAAVEAIAIFGIGTLARRVFVTLLPAGGVTKGGSPSSATNFILGYPIFGAICFLIGTVRISAATMLIPLIAGVATSLVAMRQSQVAATASPSLRTDRPHEGAGEDTRATRFALFAIAVVIACGFVTAQAPPVSLDEVAYHLAVPHTWSVEGRAIELPLLSHSYFPLGIESADLPFFAMLGPSGGTASHLLHLLAAAAVAMILWQRGRRAGRDATLITAAIVATPALAVTTGWSLVEWPLLGIFIIAALAAEVDDDATLAVAIAAGLLTKYTFVPFAIVLALLTRRWKPVAIGAAAGSLFFIRNLVLTGNPVAPFFSAHAPHVSGFRAADIAAYIFDGRFVDESLGAAMPMAIPAATGLLGWTAVGIAVLLFLAAASSRILLPYLAVGALSAARRPVSGKDEDRATPARGLFDALLIAAIAVQLLLVVWFTWRDDAFSLIAGRVSDDEYAAARRASYPAIAWVNSRLPAESRTLIIGLNETYWFEHPVRGSGNFDGPRLSAYLADPNLRAKLQRDGITHVALFAQAPPTSEARKREERETALSPEAARALSAALSTSARPAGTFDGVRLFALR